LRSHAKIEHENFRCAYSLVFVAGSLLAASLDHAIFLSTRVADFTAL